MWLAAGAVAVTPSLSVNAHYDPAYLNDHRINLSLPNWMSYLSDEVYLKDLSIVGTHNTMTYGNANLPDIVNGQSLDLKTQLQAGIRYLDIRVRHINGVFASHHGAFFNNAMFGDTLREMVNFLKENPSEVLIMRLRHECNGGAFGCSDAGNVDDQGKPISFVQTLHRYLDPIEKFIYQENRSFPQLKAVRGKILIQRDFNGDTTQYAYAYHRDQELQDSFHVNTNWDLYAKWEKVKAHLVEANKAHGKYSYMHINYLSASGGSFPYFVASGHSSSETSAPRLVTGLTTPGFSNYYPDFPRINCFIGICTIAFEGTNTLTMNYIQQRSDDGDLKGVGIVVADFPGPGLIKSVIKVNFNESFDENGNKYPFAD